MTRTTAEVTIKAPVDEVFDLVADERDEPGRSPERARAPHPGGPRSDRSVSALLKPRRP